MYTLRIDLEDLVVRETKYEEYQTFHVGPESNGYTLNVSSPCGGTAGNSVDNYIQYSLQ